MKDNQHAEPFAPVRSATAEGRSHSLRPGGVAFPCRRSRSPHWQDFLLCLWDSAPRCAVGHLVLLLPFAFRRALLSRLLCAVRSWLQGDVCFLRLPPGFPAVPPYLAHTFTAFRSRATMSAPTSLLHQTPGCPARRTFGVRAEAGSFPRAVGRFQRVAARRDYGHRIATPDCMGFGRRDLPGSCVPLSDRAAPHHTRLLRREHAHSSAPAGGFTTLRRLAFHRTPYSRVRLPAARLFVSDPPDPASRRRPVILTTPPKSDRRRPDLHWLDSHTARRT